MLGTNESLNDQFEVYKSGQQSTEEESWQDEGRKKSILVIEAILVQDDIEDDCLVYTRNVPNGRQFFPVCVMGNFRLSQETGSGRHGTWTVERICEYIILMDVFFVRKRNFNLVKN